MPISSGAVTEDGMHAARQADVIVLADRDQTLVLRCVRRVLEHSGPELGRLIVIETENDALDLEIVATLQLLAEQDSRVRLVKDSNRLGYVRSVNLGLSARERDAVLLGADCAVTQDWLAELATVAHSEERTACASPLLNGGGTCSVPEQDEGSQTRSIDLATIQAACAGLPRWTVAPMLTHHCIYLRGEVLDAVGLLDLNITSLRAAIRDWVSRAQALGFMAKRANYTYVDRSTPMKDGNNAGERVEPGHVACAQHSHLDHQLELFGKTLDCHLTAHAVRLETTGKLRVAYDIRHLQQEQVGNRTYAVSLVQALAAVPEIDLTLLVRDPAQANGLTGRVVTEEQWADDVAVIHRPAQVFLAQELELLFRSSAHVVVSYQDLIGYRNPLAFTTDQDFDSYRATSSLSLQAAQRIIAISENVAREIHAEFGIPNDDMTVVPHGVEAAWFAHREENDVAIAWRLGLPQRYFFSLATDYPHKNLHNLLGAYALLRSRWRDGEPPGLVLAGYASPARTGIYRELKSDTFAEGLRVLGPVSRDELRVLYQNATAFVFPSLYEGFGLPPLEAMAAGTPVIAMPISAVPEVGGDCVLYPDGLSVDGLARAMESLATDPDLSTEFRARGLKRVEQFRWENTARATFGAYRTAVLHPSERSLHMRRHLRDSIIRWSEPYVRPEPPVVIVLPPEPLGIRNSLKALNGAVHARLLRELGRFRGDAGRRSA
jgi:glycosyltransferase involved in cell wall biosynthesis